MSKFTEDDIKVILLVLGYDIESDDEEDKDLIKLLTEYINSLSVESSLCLDGEKHTEPEGEKHTEPEGEKKPNPEEYL